MDGCDVNDQYRDESMCGTDLGKLCNFSVGNILNVCPVLCGAVLQVCVRFCGSVVLLLSCVRKTSGDTSHKRIFVTSRKTGNKRNNSATDGVDGSGRSWLLGRAVQLRIAREREVQRVRELGSLLLSGSSSAQYELYIHYIDIYSTQHNYIMNA